MYIGYIVQDLKQFAQAKSMCTFIASIAPFVLWLVAF